MNIVVVIISALFLISSVAYYKKEIMPRRREYKVLEAKLELLSDNWPERYLLMKKYQLKWELTDMTVEDVLEEYNRLIEEFDWHN